MSGPGSETNLADFLAAHTEWLERFVRSKGAGLLRFETAQDLAQGVCLRALASCATFVHESDERSLAFLATVARRHIADRHAWWSSLRRGSARTARLSWSGSSGGDPLDRRARSQTGAMTFAARREMLELVAKAVGVLPERDRQLVRWASEAVPLAEQARRLGISYEAAQRAGLRAVERLRKAMRLASR